MSVVRPAAPKRHPLWWAYFALYVGLFLWGSYTFLSQGPVTRLMVVSILVDLLGACSLLAFLRARRFLARDFWKAFTVLYLGKMVFVAWLYLRAYAANLGHGDRENL